MSVLSPSQQFIQSGLLERTVSGANQASNNSSSNAQTDCNIYPVGQTINASNYTFDGQTVLMVNSSINQNANSVQAIYFDPVKNSNWSFGFSEYNMLSGAYSNSSLLSNDTSLYSNMNNATSRYTLDLTNRVCLDGTTQTTSDTSGLIFSLTSSPYVNSNGSYSGPGASTPTISNVNPGYSTYGTDSYAYVSHYYVPQKNEILIVQMVFTVNNTNTTANGYGGSSSPSVSVMVTNKVISRDALASLSSGSSTDNTKIKTYTAGPMPLNYLGSSSTYDETEPTYGTNNNIPVVIAPGYSKLYATLRLFYISSGSASVPELGNYLTDQILQIDASGLLTTPSPASTETDLMVGSTDYGHFVVGLVYPTNTITVSTRAVIYAEVLIRNVWRSPLSIYKSYNSYSVTDMATKLVVLLFGKSFNGGTFLVTNTGTPLNLIDNYAVTSLRNFISIMRAIINEFDGSTSLVDYFINPFTIQQVNNSGNYNIQVLSLQPLLDGAMYNPPTVLECPGMTYLMLNAKNSVNMTVDPTSQNVFTQDIGSNYLGIAGGVLCSVGNCKYFSANVNNIGTVVNDLIFGNAIYLGLNVVNNVSYYMLAILPEAQFNVVYGNTINNVLNVYTVLNSLFYLSSGTNSASQFVPSSNGVVNRNSTSQPVFNVNKLLLSVSNTKLF
jgi:hypothetical protein